MITYGTNPGMGIPVTGQVPALDSTRSPADRAAMARALEYMGLAPGAPIAGQRVDVVFIGSCTNSRMNDLRAAASVMRGHKVAPGARVLVLPGSKAIKRQAEAEGLDVAFRDAGAEGGAAGSSMRIAVNGGRRGPSQNTV